MNRGLLDFYTGQKILLQGHVDRHHVLPRAQFDAASRATADTIANMAFILEDVNRTISQTGPEVYLKKLSLKIIRSQCIPEDSALWAIDRAEEFWAARRELLAQSFNDFVAGALPSRRGLTGG